jgi:hypothetical protein
MAQSDWLVVAVCPSKSLYLGSHFLKLGLPVRPVLRYLK